MDVMKLMVVALAGWINQQQECTPKLEDWSATNRLRTSSFSRIRVFGHYGVQQMALLAQRLTNALGSNIGE